MTAALTAMDPVRYQRGTNSYCTGDVDSAGSGPPMTTSFALHNPEDAAVNPGAVVSSCPRSDFPGFIGNIRSNIVANPTGTVATTFHKWARICTVNLSAVGGGDYTLRISNGTAGRGENQFAVRAGILNMANTIDPVASAGVNIYAESKVEMLTQDSTQDMLFFLAKVQPSHVGRSLTVELYSIGDDKAADVTVLPPPNATVNNVPITSLPDCKRIRPTRDNQINAPNCTYPHASAAGSAGEPGFAGRYGTLIVPIPEGFECDTTSEYGCWLRIRMRYSSPGFVQDTTSWTTYANTQLLHLTE